MKLKLFYMVFLSVVFFVPTILPFKMAVLVSLFLFFVVSILLQDSLRVNKTVVIYFVTLMPSFFMGFLINYVKGDVFQTLKPFVFILIQSIGVWYLFSLARTHSKIEILITTFKIFTLVLTFMLLFEAFYYSIYYYGFGISSLDPAAELLYLKDGVYSKYGVTEFLNLKYSRPFGPFRYPLLAGYSLLFGALLFFSGLLERFSLFKLISLSVIVFSTILISKTSFFAFVAGAFWVILSTRSIPGYKKIILFSLIFFISLPVIYLVILKPLISGEGIGSLLIRLDIIIFAIDTFLQQPIGNVLFGHGLGFTWYGNSEFADIYYDSTSDFGMFVNILIQGGGVGLLLTIYFVIYILLKESRNIKSIKYYKSLFLACNAFLVATIVSWIGLSNYDILFWFFIALGVKQGVIRFNKNQLEVDYEIQSKRGC